MRLMLVVLVLAGAVQAGPYLTRAERSYDAAKAIVEIAERKSDDAVRHRLLVRATPVLRKAKLWYRFAVRADDANAELAGKLRELEQRIQRARNQFVAPTDRAANPVVPNTGTTVIVAAEPGTSVAGGDANAKRAARRQELNEWRIRRTLARVGTRAMRLQRERLLRLQAARKVQLAGPKNVERVAKRADLDVSRLARVEARVSPGSP